MFYGIVFITLVLDITVLPNTFSFDAFLTNKIQLNLSKRSLKELENVVS